jgi:oligopeptidase B
MSTPPIAAVHPVVSEHHGRVSTDPYAWIADPDDPQVLSYLQAERDYYDERTSGLVPLRERLAAEMISRVPELEPSAAWQAAGWMYRRVTPPGSEYDQLIRWPVGSDESAAVVLIDLQVIHDDSGSAYTREGYFEVSPDGKWLAWSVDLAGDEVYALRFRNLATGEDLDEVVERVYYGAAWSADSSAFLYTVHDDTYRPYQVWCHRLGTSVASDVMIFEDLDDRMETELFVTRSGAFAVLLIRGRGFTEVRLVPTSDVTSTPVVVRERQIGIEYELEHAPGHGPDGTDGFYVTTNLDAAEFKVMWAPASAPGEWSALIAENPAERIYGVEAFAAGYAVSLRRDGVGIVRLVSRSGVRTDITPDDAGGLVHLGNNYDWDAEAVTVIMESFLHPSVWLDVTFAGTRSERHRNEVMNIDYSRYVIEREWVQRPDGARVPVDLLRLTSTPLDGSAPCVLYGYGSYEASCDPDWGIDWWRSVPSLLDRGVVFAIGHPRGGGEMGRNWYDGGHMETKMNTFDDQAAVGEYLLDGRVSSIVTRGLSAGGLLQGALYGRRPELWAGVLAEVPFVDVVTAMLDSTLPLTAQEWFEWGNPHIAEQYDWLAAYSPMLHLPDADDRPPLLATGAVHDVRVLVREPARWVARLRASDPAQGVGADPNSPSSRGSVLLRIETGAGAHGGPSGRFGELEYEAEVYAWALSCLGISQ